MSLVIRTAEPNDRRALELLLAGLMREHQSRYPDAYPKLPPEDAAALYAAAYVARLPQDPSLVAVLAVDRAPVGLLVGEVTTRVVGRPATVCFVEWFYVAPESRGLGIGRALIRAGMTILRVHGVTHVELASAPGDRQWQRRGWQETARRYVASMESVDAWVGLEEHPNGTG
jgi:ribosomal protein S18 acetylase RimI-like enzyme